MGVQRGLGPLLLRLQPRHAVRGLPQRHVHPPLARRYRVKEWELPHRHRTDGEWDDRAAVAELAVEGWGVAEDWVRGHEGGIVFELGLMSG